MAEPTPPFPPPPGFPGAPTPPPSPSPTPARPAFSAQSVVSPYEIPEPAFTAEDDEAVRKSVTILVVGIFVVLLLVAGGVWYYLQTSKDETEDGDTQDEVVEEPDPNLISAATGGKIMTKEGLEIIIPAGALEKDTRIEATKVADGPVTDRFHLKPDGLHFLKPVTVLLPYKERGLEPGETPYDIILNVWNGAQKAVSYSVDTREEKLRFTMREF